MEPRPNRSQNLISRRCVRCNRLGLIGWYMRRRGWKDARDSQYLPIDGWSGLCRSCRIDDDLVVFQARRMVREGHDRWDDDGGLSPVNHG